MREKFLGTALIIEAMKGGEAMKMRLQVLKNLKSDIVKEEGGKKEMTDTEIINKIRKSIEGLEETIKFYMNEDDYEEETYDDELDEMVESLKNDLLKYFNKVCNIESDYLLYHIELMQENNAFDEMYILNDDLEIIYQDIAYTKTYK